MLQPLLGLGIVGAIWSIALPLMILQIFALLFLPSLMVPGAKPSLVAMSVYCYLLQLIGLIMMTAGGLPALEGVLEKIVVGHDRFSTEMYLAMLILFAAGGLTFLWHEHMALTIDHASRRVCAVIFSGSLRLIGYLLCVFSAVSFLLMMLLMPGSMHAISGLLPTLLFLYGLLLLWCTRPSATPLLTQTFFSKKPSSEKKAPTKKKK
jgi:hypothetical protein